MEGRREVGADSASTRLPGGMEGRGEVGADTAFLNIIMKRDRVDRRARTASRPQRGYQGEEGEVGSDRALLYKY